MKAKSSDGEIIANAFREVFISPNVNDSNFEPANVVDAIAYVGKAIYKLASVIDQQQKTKVD